MKKFYPFSLLLILPLAANAAPKICGQVKDYGDSLQIIDHRYNPYLTSAGEELADPKKIEEYMLRNAENVVDHCFCVVGNVKSYLRGRQTAWMFTDLAGLKKCGGGWVIR